MRNILEGPTNEAPTIAVGVWGLFGSSWGGRADGGQLGPVGLAGVKQHSDAPVGPVREAEIG